MALTKVTNNLLELDAAQPSITSVGTLTGLTVSGTATAQKLVSTNGVLELDDNGSHNGIINSPASLFLNIDSDNGATNEKFVIAKDRTGTSGGTELLKVQEDGKVAIGSTVANKIFNIADPAQGGEALKLHFEANASADKWAMYAYDRTNGHYANMSFGANSLVIDSAGHAIIGGGVTLGNGSTYAAANTLDDFETGSWTPTASGFTLGVSRAAYTKIGRMVTVSFTLTVSSATSNGSAFYITGLPFNSSGDVAESAGTVMAAYLNYGAGNHLTLYKYTGNNHISIFGTTSGSTWFQVPNSAVTTSTGLIGQITYLTS